MFEQIESMKSDAAKWQPELTETSLSDYMLTLASAGDLEAIEWVIEHIMESSEEDSEEF
jgi:hypothetical protein